MPDILSIASDQLSATISPVGAELQTLRDAAGRDLLWNGDPAWWTGRAPILFPVIGVTNGGVIHVDGQAYKMPKHGFVRHRALDVVSHDAASAHFRLEADAETRAAYPFDFRLDLNFAIEGARLQVTADLTNPAATPLPASFGFHPALLWPLPYGGDRDAHCLIFDRPEPAPIRRIDTAGQLTPEPRATPIDGDTLVPRDALFEEDALIFDRLASRSARWGVPGEPGLRIDWEGLPELGVWTKPGAPYLCVEPWAGIADPQGYGGDFCDKPGVIEVAPGATRRFAMGIAVEA